MSTISRRHEPGLKPTLYPPVSSFILPMVYYGIYGPGKMWKNRIWYKNHTKPYKIQALEHQEDPMCHGDPKCASLWTSHEAFGNVFGLQHIPTCMSCDSELTPDYDTCNAMVSRSTPMATVKHIKTYLDTCASHMST